MKLCNSQSKTIMSTFKHLGNYVAVKAAMEKKKEKKEKFTVNKSIQTQWGEKCSLEASQHSRPRTLLF